MLLIVCLKGAVWYQWVCPVLSVHLNCVLCPPTESWCWTRERWQSSILRQTSYHREESSTAWLKTQDWHNKPPVCPNVANEASTISLYFSGTEYYLHVQSAYFSRMNLASFSSSLGRSAVLTTLQHVSDCSVLQGKTVHWIKTKQAILYVQVLVEPRLLFSAFCQWDEEASECFIF